MSTPPSHSTYVPGSPASGSGGGAGSGSAFPSATSVPMQDLSGDQVIKNATRSDYMGQAWPTLGGIPLLARLGEGGMGTVYYGYHVRLDQEVAVKVLPFFRAAQNPNLIQRFYREARMAAKVHSPRLVGVFDINEENGLHYIVMEFVRGASAGGLLKRVIEAGQIGLNEADALGVCIAAAEGIAAAHAQGIIHRDIKPDNVLVPEPVPGAPRFQEAKLADLGLARGDAASTALTGTNAMMGSPGFLAPEQAMDARTAGKRSDIFSLGATLYALLAGQPPFTGPNALAAAYASVRAPHKPIRDLRADTSPATAALIDRCLSKKPEERCADGAALLQALRLCRQELGQPETVQHSVVQQLSALASVAEVGRPYQYVSEQLSGATPSPQAPQQIVPSPVPPPANTPLPRTLPSPAQATPIPMTLQTPVPPTLQTPVPPTLQTPATPQPGVLPFTPPAPAPPSRAGAVFLALGLAGGLALIVLALLLFAFSGKIRQWISGDTPVPPPVPVVPPPPPEPTPSPFPFPKPVPAPFPVPPPAPAPVPVPPPVQAGTFESRLASAQLKLGQGLYDAALNIFVPLSHERPNAPDVLDGLRRTGKGLLDLGDRAAKGTNNALPDPNHAEFLYNKAALAFREAHESSQLSDALYRQSLYLMLDRNPRGDYAKAVACLKECLSIDTEARNEIGLADTLAELGWCHRPGNLPAGSWAEAIRYYQQAAALDGRLGRKKELADQNYALGYCYQPDHNEQGEWFRAASYYESSARTRAELADKQGQAEALHQQAWCLAPPNNTRANADRTAQLFEQAARLRAETNDTGGRGKSLYMQAWCLQPTYNNRGDWGRAAALFGQSAMLFNSAKDRENEANAYHWQGVSMCRGNKANLTNVARQMFQRASAICRELNDEAGAKRSEDWLQ
ncbi:MAG: protein kinase [Planctomycetes bacterium]|nr:protein kinase [Planctomycetota bacterium]